MSRVKIKKFVPKKVFKAIVFSSAIPILIFIAISAFVALVTSQSVDSSFITKLLHIAFSPLAYGAVAMIFAASYNWLAPKLGELEIEISDEGNEQEIMSDRGVLDEVVGKKI